MANISSSGGICQEAKRDVLMFYDSVRHAAKAKGATI